MIASDMGTSERSRNLRSADTQIIDNNGQTEIHYDYDAFFYKYSLHGSKVGEPCEKKQTDGVLEETSCSEFDYHYKSEKDEKSPSGFKSKYLKSSEFIAKNIKYKNGRKGFFDAGVKEFKISNWIGKVTYQGFDKKASLEAVNETDKSTYSVDLDFSLPNFGIVLSIQD